MSTALRISTSRSGTSRRVPLLASASGLIAAASIAVTLAVAGGGGDSASRPSSAPAKATPDRATLYHYGVKSPRPFGAFDGERSAERFHHFR
jgi:hypothetical protein